MRRTLLLGLLVLVGCVGCAAGRRAPAPDVARLAQVRERGGTRLCIESRAGVPVAVYTRAGRRLGTTPRASGGCVRLPLWVVETGEPLCVRAVVGMDWCEPLPGVAWAQADVWLLRLGLLVGSWRYDVGALAPAPAA